MRDDCFSSSPSRPHVALAISFVEAIQAGLDPSSFVTPDVVEEEMPNRVFARGATRDLAAMQAAALRGKALFRRQVYTVTTAVEEGEVAVLELTWTGELAQAMGALAEGATMRAEAAFFFHMRAGKIARIRHYDAFEPF
jgi:ketosteroid isomerase-like protein